MKINGQWECCIQPMRDKYEGMFIPGGRREDTRDYGLSRELESKDDV